MTLRTKSDRFVYTKAGEKISGPAVMQYMGKTIPSCYVSGDAVGVLPTPIPFDMNTDNVLPSNMVYLAERYLKGDPLTMALVFSGVETLVGTRFKIELSFLSPGYAQKKVNTHAMEILRKLDLSKEVLDYDLVYGIWDKLMFEGLKGLNILKVSEKTDTYLSIDAPLANQYFLTKTAIRAQGFAPLNNAPAGGLNLVK